MKDAIVGYTGFVGSNLLKEHHFEGQYNSKNIQEAFGTNPDLLVYSGLRAEKFLANKYPEKDFNSILEAIDNIKKINPKCLVFLSTIDVYKNVENINEDYFPEDDNLPYGKNRAYLEKWALENFDNVLIVRLPGLFGMNLKKNLIFDMIQYVPSMLNESKYKELSEKSELIKNSYEKQDNTFYKLIENSDELKNEFKEVGFSALNFTDSRGIFQYYNLAHLWKHINIALENNIKILNLATEPISATEIYHTVFNEEFKNEIMDQPFKYNFKTKYDKVFNGKDGYIYSKEQVLDEIKKYIGERI
ncbi:hypothetical protein HMPREF0979_01835 [Coprobacillus sp. 8_1_38FAA]|nr:hypothetical protein HMPREF0979_01835 [Coprobacillus sp. 8_1_38FAA]